MKFRNSTFYTLHSQLPRGGAAFAMVVSPGWLGGRFAWTNSCCSISSYGGMFTYSCGDSCTCTGCAALGYYTYESYLRRR